MIITCSVTSWLCHGTRLPGRYSTWHSSTCSPPIACRWTPSTNSQAWRPCHVRNGDDLDIGGEETGAVVRRERPHRDCVVEDHALAVAPRLALRLDRREHALRRRGHLGHPHAHGVVDRVRDGGRLRVVRHLADRLGAERTVLGRILEDHVVELRQILERRAEIRTELPAAMVDRRIARITVLEQSEPEAHDRAALDLPFDERRIDRTTDVVD